MEALAGFFKKRAVTRVIIFGLIILILYSVRSMLNLILLTFIFSFLMNGLVEFITKRIRIHRATLILFLYAIVAGVLTIGIIRYLPVISLEISQLIRQITNFSAQSYDNKIIKFIESIVTSNQIKAYMESGFSFILRSFTDISKTSIQVLIALILSLFFLLEKKRLIKFTDQFKDSKISMFYDEIAFFGKRFSLTFGKVLEAQFMIAVINTALSIIILLVLGFPQVVGLSIMIFFLGLIPVAGVIISLIPLSIIAFTIGGVMKVVYLLIAVSVVHAIEAYILNPKLMSSKTNLPVFYTFIVLIFSQNFFGVWGLIIGIPVFVFLLDVLNVIDKPKPPKPKQSLPATKK